MTRPAGWHWEIDVPISQDAIGCLNDARLSRRLFKLYGSHPLIHSATKKYTANCRQ